MLNQIKKYFGKLFNRTYEKFSGLTEFSPQGHVFSVYDVYLTGSKEPITQRHELLSRKKSDRIRNHPLYQKHQQEKAKRLEESLPHEFAEKVHSLGGTCLSMPKE